jgi:C4-dicarboxylate-specific signal transduction histidine kinase
MDEKMFELFGVDPKEFSGAYQAWESTLSTKAKQEAVKELELALSGEKDFNTEFEIKLKNNESRHIAGRGTVFRNKKNEAIKMIGLNWDVTDRVRAEHALKVANVQLAQSSKLASLGEISAGIAHEINNPLTIIIGSIGLLSMFIDQPEKFLSKIQMIQKSCDRIARIVNGLRKFSRSGVKPSFQKIELATIMNEALILTELKSKHFSTPITIDCKSNAKVNCDEIEIEQVLINLINNAIDAVKMQLEKWVKLSVFEEDASVIVWVMDSDREFQRLCEINYLIPSLLQKSWAKERVWDFRFLRVS